MVVCHCKMVNDQTIAKLARKAGRELSVEDITAHCGAGGPCGGCYDSICDILEARLHESSRSS